MTNSEKIVGKVYRSGTHRTIAPEKTIAKIKPHMKRMGITRIANVTGLDRIGLPVVMVTRPNARSVSVSQGKGIDLEAARASALMESVETWHAENIDIPVIYSAYTDLKNKIRVAEPNSLAQVQGSNFSDTLRTLWIEGASLVDNQPIFVPYEMVHTDYTQPSPPGHGCFHCSTNGLASGNHIIEAQCHAICEVIERDATTILHHLSPQERDERLIGNDSIDDLVCQKIIEQLTQQGLNLAIWDCTTDIGVPSFYALLINNDSEMPEHIGAGAGCHPNKSIALSRTITEAIQTRLTYISGARDDLLSDEFDDGGLRQKYTAAIEFIGDFKPERDYRAIREYDSDTIDDDISWLIERLQNIGINQIICIDLTKPDINISVVRIIIPGLEAPHDDDDFLPGARLGELP